MNNIKVILVSISVLAVLGAVLWWFAAPTPPVDLSNVELDSEEYWQAAIATEGGKEAYELLDTASASETDNQRHLFAHVFGGALYKEEGVHALPACDARFSYGCFHEFIGRAIAEKGLGAVAALNTACVEMLGSDAAFCQHGVGHGIQTYHGYKEHDVQRALEVCSELPDNDPIGGCAGGIFMEYNLRTMAADDAVGREVSTKTLYEPCMRLSGDQKRACVYWQTQWWHEIQFSASDDPSDFAVMGAQCRTLAQGNSMFLRDCFEGIGNVIPGIEPITLEQGEELCRAAAHDKEHQTYCIEVARERISAR